MSLHSLNVHPPLSYSMCRMAIGKGQTQSLKCTINEYLISGLILTIFKVLSPIQVIPPVSLPGTAHRGGSSWLHKTVLEVTASLTCL